MDLNSILTVIGIISPFILAAVWMATLITKTSNRALLLEVAQKDHEKRLIELESATSYTAVEKVVEKICKQIFHSKEFKDSLKDSIQDTMLHIDQNKSNAEAGALSLILDEVRRMHTDIINKYHPHS